MKQLFWVTLKGVVRDRVFRGVLLLAFALLLIPSLSTLSMRQVPELALTLSLALISFISLLLAIFLGGTALWKDLERRYTFSVLGLPLSRGCYLLGKFFGIALFLVLVVTVLGLFAVAVQWQVWQNFAPGRPQPLSSIALALLFLALKYVLVVAVAFLFSTVSTSFFLPIFGALSVFFVGSASQEVYEFIHSPNAQLLSPAVRDAANLLYYLLPNLSAFDLQIHAVYGVPLDSAGLWTVLAYFVCYTGAVLALACGIFSRRELS